MKPTLAEEKNAVHFASMQPLYCKGATKHVGADNSAAMFRGQAFAGKRSAKKSRSPSSLGRAVKSAFDAVEDRMGNSP